MVTPTKALKPASPIERAKRLTLSKKLSEKFRLAKTLEPTKMALRGNGEDLAAENSWLKRGSG